MKSNKELNKAVASILGEPEIYDVRENLTVIKRGVTYNEALGYLSGAGISDNNPNYAITSSPSSNYVGDVELALYAAQRIAERNQCTFVLSLEDGVWVGSFGNWGDCSQYKGSNPAYATCVSLLKFMGRL